jgi:hypothetical protein
LRIPPLVFSVFFAGSAAGFIPVIKMLQSALADSGFFSFFSLVFTIVFSAFWAESRQLVAA